MNWTNALIAEGVDVTPESDGSIAVRLGPHKARYVLHSSARSPRPSEVQEALVPSLFQVPHVSARSARLLETAGWSYATSDGEALLQFPDGFLWRSSEKNESAVEQDPTHGVKLWSLGMSSIVHALLLHDPEQLLTQSALANVAGISQAHASRVVGKLRDAGLVSTVRGRPKVLDHDALIDQWLVRRGFDPVVTYWSTDQDLAEFLGRLRQHMPNSLVSGDIAADALAPHRRPHQLLVLSDHGSLSGTGAIAVLTREEANVILTITSDPVVLASGSKSTWRKQSILVADPYQVLWDLGHSIGTDAQQAAASWRTASARWPR